MVPVILITGFLGSGKTTFVNYLLQKYPDYKFSVILNEFGDIKLESQFIMSHKKDIIELANGCMCCVAKSDVPRVIDLILEKSPQTQFLVIEASGLSDPDPTHESFNDPRIASNVALSKIVCIVDAMHFLQMKDTYRTIMAQLADSDIAIISKVEEAGEEKAIKIKTMIKTMMPLTEVVLFDKSFDPSILFGGVSNTSNKQSDEDHHHTHEDFKEYWLIREKPLSKVTIEQAYSNLPQSIIRSKGIILMEDGGKRLIQYVKGNLEIIEGIWEDNEVKKTQILFIGTNFDEIEIENLFS